MLVSLVSCAMHRFICEKYVYDTSFCFHFLNNMFVVVFVFTPEHSNPVYTTENVVTDGSIVTAASFIPNLHVNDSNLNWNQRSNLYFVTSYQVNTVNVV